MSGTIYSYKPAGGGMEGASTVVVTKTGQLLELRWGTVTRWWAAEDRKRWASLEEWKATLPAGAEVTERPAMYPSAVAAPSADFQAILAVAKKHRIHLSSHTVSISSNATDAARCMRAARKADRRGRWGATLADRRRAEAATILAKPAYSRHVCRNKQLMWTLQVQREDGVFVPLLVDKSRHLLHIPVLDGIARKRSHEVDRMGATVADLGVRPVILLQTWWGTRMMTLEEMHAEAVAE